MKKNGGLFNFPKLNNEHGYLQEELDAIVDYFNSPMTFYVDGKQITAPRMQMLSEIASRTPFIVFDHPLLCLKFQTAVTDGCRIYFNAHFLKEIFEQQKKINEIKEKDIPPSQTLAIEKIFNNAIREAAPIDLCEFIIAHETEHIRRLHLQRMMDIDPDLANRAQDIRINQDIMELMALEWLMSGNRREINTYLSVVSNKENREAIVQQYIDLMASSSEIIKSGQGMGPNDVKKFSRKTEEEIASLLATEKSLQPEQKNIDFNELCEAVSQDFEDIGKNGLPEAGKLAQKIKTLGSRLSSMPRNDIQDLAMDIFKVAKSSHMNDRDARHNNQTASGNQSVTNVSKEIADMPPSKRSEHLLQALAMSLFPEIGKKSPGRNGSANNKGTEKNGKHGKEQNDDPILGEREEFHTTTPEELAEILKQAGLDNVVEKLGYDDLEKLEKQINEASDRVNEAIERSKETLNACGNVLPGRHLTEYAIEMRKNFYKPVINWKTPLEDALLNNKDVTYRVDELTPTNATIAVHESPEEFGFGSNESVWEPANTLQPLPEKSFVAVIIDTSGSMSEHQIDRAISETIGIVEANKNEASPEVAICFADTVCRGEPLFIDADNKDEIIQKGIAVAGRGGTNLTAAIQNVFRWTEDENNPFYKRDIKSIVFFTDTFDAPPKLEKLMEYLPEHMDELPNITFLAPIECAANVSFKKAIEEYGQCIFFDAQKEFGEQTVDLTAKTRIPKIRRKAA